MQQRFFSYYRHVVFNFAVLQSMKWILLKTGHVEAIIFDFKHAGTLVKVQTRHMVLIIIQSRLVKTADEWEADQWVINGPVSDNRRAVRNIQSLCTEANIQKCSQNSEMWIIDYGLNSFFKTQKDFHGNIIRKIKQKNVSVMINHALINRNQHFDGYIQGNFAPFWWTNPVTEHNVKHKAKQEVWDPTFRCRTRNL